MDKEPLFPASGIVYLLTIGDYEDYNDVGITSSPEKAKEFMDQFPDEDFNEPKKIIIDDLIKVPKGKYPYFVRVSKDGVGILEVRECSKDIHHANLITDGKIDLDHRCDFMVYVWAENSEVAKSIAIEKVNQGDRNL